MSHHGVCKKLPQVDHVLLNYPERDRDISQLSGPGTSRREPGQQSMKPDGSSQQSEHEYGGGGGGGVWEVLRPVALNKQRLRPRGGHIGPWATGLWGCGAVGGTIQGRTVC